MFDGYSVAHKLVIATNSVKLKRLRSSPIIADDVANSRAIVRDNRNRRTTMPILRSAITDVDEFVRSFTIYYIII
jgi:hypothetical protein